jgi:hypothetical protein
MKRRRNKQSGQTMIEYVLMLLITVSMVTFVYKWLKSSEFFYKNITRPMIAQLRYNYKYGDPVAQGWDEGAPKKHIEIPKPDGQTFRIFTPVEN